MQALTRHLHEPRTLAISDSEKEPSSGQPKPRSANPKAALMLSEVLPAMSVKAPSPSAVPPIATSVVQRPGTYWWTRTSSALLSTT